MEYIVNISDNLKEDTSGMDFVNIFQYPELVFGTVAKVGSSLNFEKYPAEVGRCIEQYGDAAVKEYFNLSKCAAGCRLRFYTDSKRICIKAKLFRKWYYKKMNGWNSSGFDIYSVKNGEYKHQYVFGPEEGKDCFAECINIDSDRGYCIFLPNYNTIMDFWIGIEKKSKIIPFPYIKSLPIVFYGNSVTQGASASRSGNSFPNVVSRILDRDIINLSVSSCCHGQMAVADEIGSINCAGIVLDFTRNVKDVKSFEAIYERFYRRIRDMHEFTPIILMTAPYFSGFLKYIDYDQVVIKAYEQAKMRGENVFLINQMDLIDQKEYDLVSLDGVHYTDYGMYIVAKALENCLERE